MSEFSDNLPHGEENRSACRSYTKVSSDHQRSGLESC